MHRKREQGRVIKYKRLVLYWYAMLDLMYITRY
jgi:hypothetical protein